MALPRYDTSRMIIYRIIPLLHLITNIIEVDIEKYKMIEIFIFLRKQVKLEGKNHPAVITNTNTSDGIKNLNFLRKRWGEWCYICPMFL